jgi:hypothetical protein
LKVSISFSNVTQTLYSIAYISILVQKAAKVVKSHRQKDENDQEE